VKQSGYRHGTGSAPFGVGSGLCTVWAALVAAFAVFVIGCAGAAPAGSIAKSDIELAGSDSSDEQGDEPPSHLGWRASAEVPSSAEVPVDARDPAWGAPSAPVTIVAFTDLQCPFCARAHDTVERLRRDYGPDRLRVVIKHNPLPFHNDALPAAVTAQAVYELAGPETFFAFVTKVFEHQRSLSDADLVRYAQDVGVDRGTLLARGSSPELERKVREDMALAQELGATGTPAFRINGITLTGAQPYDRFAELIDAELQASRQLLAQGVSPQQVYAKRVASNFTQPAAPTAARPSGAGAATDDSTVWKVPLGKSPSRGPADALVTIVQFSEYQCPFCKRVEPTIDELLKRYPKQVRLIFKHNPLPFHNRAMPASLLAAEARAQRGDKGFWQAHEQLFQSQPRLEDEDLLAIAEQLKLDKARVKRAIANETHKAAIEKDMELASDIDARGTPTFFINGRKLSGAQPLDRFVSLVDEELAKAKQLMSAKRIPAARVYAQILKDAKSAPAPEKKKIAAPSHRSPSRGPAKAPIVVQAFMDFQCPFCKRALPTIEQLEKAYPGRIRVVFRNLPLSFHAQARPAAAAAMEALAQGGNKSFWQMHDLLFAGLDQPGGLERPALERYAAKLGLDLERFRQALDDGRHDASIGADEAQAKAAGIQGTPAFVINGYYVSGAQPLRSFQNAVKHALADAAKGKRP
jgi:protein-disulfide isomerase